MALSVDVKGPLVPKPLPGVAVKGWFGPLGVQVSGVGSVDWCDRKHRLLLPFTLQRVNPLPVTVHLKVKVSSGQVGGAAANCPVTSPGKKGPWKHLPSPWVHKVMNLTHYNLVQVWPWTQHGVRNIKMSWGMWKLSGHGCAISKLDVMSFPVVLMFLILFFLFQFSNEHLSVLHKCRSCVHWNPKPHSYLLCRYIYKVNMFVYTVVLWKSAHGQSTLHAHQKRSGHPFMFSNLTTKERPCHVYSDSMPSKQITRQTITHNRTTSSFKVKAWRHTTHHVTTTISVHCIS